MSSQSPCPLSKGNHYSDFCHHRLILPIFGLYIKVITYYAIFCVRHLLRNILSRRFIHAAAWCDSLSYDCHVVFRFMGYTTIYLSILLLTDICFQIGTITKNADMNILVHVFWCTLCPVLLGLCLEMELLTFNFHEHY